MFHDPVLLAGVANGGLLPGEVACCAQRGDISRIRRRGGIELAQGAMRAVAVPAEGRVGTTLRGQGAVRALAVAGAPPVWHCTLAMREWREPANSAALTYRDPDCPAPVPLRVGLEWHLRQSPLDIPCE